MILMGLLDIHIDMPPERWWVSMVDMFNFDVEAVLTFT
jgi:hypothetical protein